MYGCSLRDCDVISYDKKYSESNIKITFNKFKSLSQKNNTDVFFIIIIACGCLTFITLELCFLHL